MLAVLSVVASLFVADVPPVRAQTLVVKAKPWAKCKIAGRDEPAKTTRFEVRLRPGVYEIQCKRLALSKTRAVKITRRGETTLMVDMTRADTAEERKAENERRKQLGLPPLP